MLRIGEFSKLSKTSIKLLRYYDKIGLLKPAMTDSTTQYRYYTFEQLEIIRLISMYKDIGFSNEMISKLIYKKTDERTLLKYQKQVLNERMEDIKKALYSIDVLLGEENGQKYEVSVKNVEKRLVYCCRGYISSVDNIHEFIQRCSSELSQTNPDVRFSEPDYCCVIYPDDSYRESNIFIEYAQSVDRKGKDTEVIKFKELDPITAVSVIHYGKYDNLRDVYLFAVNWANTNGYTIDGEPRERYIHGAWDTQSESEWVTEIQLPIRRNK